MATVSGNGVCVVIVLQKGFIPKRKFSVREIYMI
jgi:hypothetical protein